MITKNKSDDDPENSDELEQKIDSYVNAMVSKIKKKKKNTSKISKIKTYHISYCPNIAPVSNFLLRQQKLSLINSEETNEVTYTTKVTQISARLDCVENLTRQRHDRGQTENQQNAATVDSCFELVGSRQHGVAQQKVEQPARAEWSTKCTW